MHVPLISIPRLILTQKCQRCGLQFSKKEEHCPHCHELSEQELILLKEKIETEQEGNKNLGKLFLFIALLTMLVSLLALL